MYNSAPWLLIWCVTISILHSEATIPKAFHTWTNLSKYEQNPEHIYILYLYIQSYSSNLCSILCFYRSKSKLYQYWKYEQCTGRASYVIFLINSWIWIFLNPFFFIKHWPNQKSFLLLVPYIKLMHLLELSFARNHYCWISFFVYICFSMFLDYTDTLSTFQIFRFGDHWHGQTLAF